MSPRHGPVQVGRFVNFIPLRDGPLAIDLVPQDRLEGVVPRFRVVSPVCLGREPLRVKPLGFDLALAEFVAKARPGRVVAAPNLDLRLDPVPLGVLVDVIRVVGLIASQFSNVEHEPRSLQRGYERTADPDCSPCRCGTATSRRCDRRGRGGSGSVTIKRRSGPGRVCEPRLHGPRFASRFGPCCADRIENRSPGRRPLAPRRPSRSELWRGPTSTHADPMRGQPGTKTYRLLTKQVLARQDRVNVSTWAGKAKMGDTKRLRGVIQAACVQMRRCALPPH